MKRISALLPAIFAYLVLAGCGGSSSGTITTPPPPPPPPPPPADQSPQGIWGGDAVTTDIPDTLTSFEFDDADGFEVGTAPFTADFQGGVAQDSGNAALNTDGTFSWHVSAGTDGTVTFAVPPSTLNFFARVVTLGDLASVSVKDTNGDEIALVVLTDAFQEINVARDPGAGDTLIGSVTVTVTPGEVVVDSLGYTYPSTASTDDIGCVIIPAGEIVCLISDAVTGEIISSANGTVSVDVDQVTGSGWVYAAPGRAFPDGSTVAPITISTGVVSEGTSLDLTIDGVGVPVTVTSLYDDTYERGADLATVAASYTTFDIFGDPSTFDVDANGAISGTSTAGCLLMGQLSVVGAALNVYDVAITVTDGGGGTCGVPDGDYNGLGITQDEAATDDLFVFGAFVDGASSLPGAAVK